MRDLSVYYCKRCGYYAYYQLPKNAVCPKCDMEMDLMDMHYLDFMDLDYEERDLLISQKILEAAPSFIHRICEPANLYNQREVIGHLTHELTNLQEENQKLSKTIDWMHQTIWDQLRKTKYLECQLKELKEEHQTT